MKNMNNYCDITFVLDRSGSMMSILDDTIGGFNMFLKEQQKLNGKCVFSLIQFNTDYEYIYNGVHINYAKELTNKTFIPMGGTALLDSLGKAINETGNRLRKMNEVDRPNKVLFIILTDGEENSSHSFTKQQIFDMISHQKDKYNWEFIFLAANQDAIKAGAQLGVDFGKSMLFAANKVGTQNTYTSINAVTTEYRTSSGKMKDFDQNDRDNAIKA